MLKLKHKQALSEVTGAIIIAAIIMAISISWLTMETTRSTQQTNSIIDMMRASQKSHQQNLNLAYYYKQDNNLHLYLYNYGTQNTTPQFALMNQETTIWNTIWKFQWYNITDSKGTFGQQINQTSHTGTNYTINNQTPPINEFQNKNIGYIATTTLYFTDSPTITIQTSNGMEVYINNQPIFQANAYYTQTQTTYTKTLSLQPGTYQITTKWYQWQENGISSFSTTNTPTNTPLTITNMETKQPTQTIPPNTLVKLTLPTPTTNTIDLMITTYEGGIFNWHLTT